LLDLIYTLVNQLGILITNIGILECDKMKWFCTILVACIAIVSIVTGCSSKVDNSSKTSTNPPAVNQEKSSQLGKLIEPDELISKSEAQQLIGETVKDAEKKETKQVGMKLCVYNSISGSKFLQVSVTQAAFMPQNGQSPKSIYATLKNNLKDATKVDGVGDEAFIAPPGLHLLKNNYYITIAVGNSGNAKNREILKLAGLKAVENLEKLAGR